MVNRRNWMAHCSGLIAVTGAQGALPKRRHVVVVGDSLSAEYGIAQGSGWVRLLERRLERERPGTTVFNASISGDTTAGGRSRLPALLTQQRPTHVLIELGGNDALRGLPLSHTRDNLRQMIRAVRAAGAQAVLIGMQVPPNYGSRYTQDFAALFGELAREEKVAWVPFLLAGVADQPNADAWFQADRIHPLAKAHPVMCDTVWAVLQKFL
ncbi:arylesterase [Inhella gelatinilytica]|uniref:Arylesterase n=1 Tax=Inhella gelatinilytica TaxID=2795030 RepID=A0A931NDR4_9BURK|nr:arylesterase [Inhella gelatinilytica]MBH9552515.1 arylesterase [Inhella gelatinilytica]